MLFSFNAFSAVATWCMFMCLFETGRHVLELAVCFLAGFVYDAHASTLGFGLNVASYALFLASLQHRQLVAPAPVVDTSVQVRIEGDDI